MKRVTQITSEMIEDVKEMLIYLGVPVIEAPSEAEAQCAELVRSGKAYAVASEDMDALAFGALILLRGFHNKKEPTLEINFTEVLNLLDFTYEEFVDLCILLGCDYCKTIGGIGAVKAYKLIKQCSKIETILEFIKTCQPGKYQVSSDFNYADARKLFRKPKVINTANMEFVWNPPNEEKIKEFLVGCRGFSLHRVENSFRRLKKSHIGSQPKIDNFFSIPIKRNNETTDSGQKKPKVDSI
jgi:flap endonuclease-1